MDVVMCDLFKLVADAHPTARLRVMKAVNAHFEGVNQLPMRFSVGVVDPTVQPEARKGSPIGRLINEKRSAREIVFLADLRRNVATVSVPDRPTNATSRIIAIPASIVCNKQHYSPLILVAVTSTATRVGFAVRRALRVLLRVESSVRRPLERFALQEATRERCSRGRRRVWDAISYRCVQLQTVP